MDTSLDVVDMSVPLHIGLEILVKHKIRLYREQLPRLEVTTYSAYLTPKQDVIKHL